MARCKTDMLSGLIRKSPLAPLFPPGQRPYGPAAKEGDNNFLLWQRGNKGDFVNCRSSNNSNTSPLSEPEALPPGQKPLWGGAWAGGLGGRGKFTFYEFNTNEPIAKVFFCGSISSPRTEKVNDFNLSPFTLSREPVLRLRSGHSETTVHPEPVEGWCWLFTSSSQMIKQRFLDFFRNLKKLRRNVIPQLRRTNSLSHM